MDSRRPRYRPPAPPRRRRLPAHVYRRRRVIVGLAAVTVLYVLYLGITLALALFNPSYGISTMARAAEWGRQHSMGPVVTWFEAEYYKLNPPKVGGAPPTSSFGSGATAIRVRTGSHIAPPARIPSPAGTPLPGEGVWHAAGRTNANGTPALYEAFVRPNAVNTSYVVGVAWMDPTMLQAQLYSGSQIPGTQAHWQRTAPVTAGASKSIVAAFNAGFRMGDANGGYYTQGRTIIPLRTGAASAVIFKDGTMTVGQWGRDVSMSHQVEAVRQNLDLIVDNARPVAGLNNPNAQAWGKTLGGSFSVWRSGMGVTSSGALIYVGGPSLSISDLANVLVRAGAVRAMELDINTDWVQFSAYTGALNSPVNGGNGVRLLPSMLGSPSQYFSSWWARDFFTMSLRPAELKRYPTGK